MGVRVTNILKVVRDRLSDPAKERFSDEQLLSYLNTQSGIVCAQARLLVGEAHILLKTGVSTYSLPANCLGLTRVVSADISLPIVSTSSMDTEDSGWEGKEGDRVTAVVYDNGSMNDIRVHPTPMLITAVSGIRLEPAVIRTHTVRYTPSVHGGGEFSTVATWTVSPSIDPIYGIVSDVEGYETPQYGLMVDVQDSPSNPTQLTAPQYGLLSDWLVETEADLVAHFNKSPAKVTLADEPEYPPAFDTAVGYFVTADALMVSQDTQSVPRAANFIKLGERALSTVSRNTSTNYAEAENTLAYNTGF